MLALETSRAGLGAPLDPQEALSIIDRFIGVLREVPGSAPVVVTFGTEDAVFWVDSRSLGTYVVVPIASTTFLSDVGDFLGVQTFEEYGYTERPYAPWATLGDFIVLPTIGETELVWTSGRSTSPRACVAGYAQGHNKARAKTHSVGMDSRSCRHHRHRHRSLVPQP